MLISPTHTLPPVSEVMWAGSMLWLMAADEAVAAPNEKWPSFSRVWAFGAVSTQVGLGVALCELLDEDVCGREDM